MLRNSLFAFAFAFAVPLLCPALVRAAGPALPPPPDVKIVAPPPTGADAGAGTGAGSTVAHMEDIQAQTLLYKAQLLRDRALAELQKISSNSDSLTVSGTSLPYDTSAIQSAPAASARDDTPPQVVQITGEGKTLSALIRTNRGSQLIVHAGNTIPGTNLKVDKITFDAVTVSKAGKTPRILAFVED
ncbi:type IV pilus biogenesis protein PilP [Salmonella enterica subsp. enterica serovar Newport]|nr:type IV pilus biogenesis protein PilP [Salmonella enterica subsp. enterica serovar Newport]